MGGILMREPDRIREAAVLLATYKHKPEPVSFPTIAETIRNFTAADLAHVGRLAAALERRDQEGPPANPRETP